MASLKQIRSLAMASCAAWFVACASSAPTPETAPAVTTSVEEAQSPANIASKPEPVWSGTTEAEVAAALERKFQEAARGYVKLKKDGVMMFCKRYRVIGSNIPTIQCITEAELRNQVENMDDYRQRMRDSAKCTHGVGCQS
jgi:hypothetical protein